MVRLLGLGVLVQIAVCSFVGLRLMRLAWRTRQLPEAAFGLAFVLLGSVGYPLSIAARSLQGDPALAGTLLAVGLAAQNVASLAIMLGTARSFHAGSKVAQAAIWIAAVGFVASLVGHGQTVGFAGGRDGGAFYQLGFALRFGSFAWSSAVAFVHHARLERRLAIGLADPVAADRIRLWALTTLAICVGFVVFGLGRILTPNVGESPVVLATTSLIALASALTMSLAFFPPPAYLARVRRGAEADPDAAQPPTRP